MGFISRSLGSIQLLAGINKATLACNSIHTCSSDTILSVHAVDIRDQGIICSPGRPI